MSAFEAATREALEERRNGGLLRLSLGNERAFFSGCLEPYIWEREMKNLAYIWGYALRNVEYEKRYWGVYDVFGGLENKILEWAIPSRIAKNKKENDTRWEEVKAAAIDGGIESYLEAYWEGVPLEDLIA